MIHSLGYPQYQGLFWIPLIHGTIWSQGGCGLCNSLQINITPIQMTVMDLMECFNRVVCSSCITRWREYLHWDYNICRTFHHEWRNILRAFIDIYDSLFVLLTMVSSPPTPHMPVLKDFEIIGSWEFVLPILRGVGRGDIWIQIQNWKSSAGIGKNQIMWYLEEDDSVCWEDIICV